MLTTRGHPVVLLMGEDLQECSLLKWKTQRKIQRKGRELDATYFNDEERKAFREADTKEWNTFLETGAIEVVLPAEALKIPTAHSFARPRRRVLTHNNN